MEKQERNLTFTILSAIGIFLIILGHLDFGILEFGGLFPYYSYHVLIFVFISGYFYRENDEKDIPGFIKRKAKRLLLPYLVCNIITGILVNLLHGAGILYGGSFNLYNLLIAPFEGGHQFMLNAPGWFIPALFVLELCNVIGRRILSLIKLDNEYVVFALYLAMGTATVFLARRGSVYDWYKFPGRLLFMAPVLQLGRLYRTKLEKKDTLNNTLYFLVILILNLILVLTQGGLAFSAVWVSGFANSPVIPYITTVTGIALWLRISKIIASIPGKHVIANYIGSHTLQICLYHLFGWLALGGLYLAMNRLFGIFEDFDVQRFCTDVYYAYTPGGIEAAKWIYVLVSFLLPLGLCLIGDKICGLLTNGKTTK